MLYSSILKSSLLIERTLNPVLWEELLHSRHPNHQLPSGSLEKMANSQVFAILPMVLFPLASRLTLGFTILQERGTARDFALRYGHRADLDHSSPDDAQRFIGRGLYLPRFVGRKLYRECSEAIGVDLIDQPDSILTDASVLVAVAEWQIERAIPTAGKSLNQWAIALGGDSRMVEPIKDTMAKWLYDTRSN